MYNVVIGRCQVTKVPHIGLEASIRANMECIFFTPTLEGKDTQEYYQKKIEPLLSNPLVELRVGIPYNEIMDTLAGAHCCISTWCDESSGIVALEASERGVPTVIVNRGGMHASFDLIKYGPIYTVNKSENRGNKLYDALAEKILEVDTSPEYRDKLKAATIDHFNKDAFYDRLIEFIETRLKPNTQEVALEQFMIM